MVEFDPFAPTPENPAEPKPEVPVQPEVPGNDGLVTTDQPSEIKFHHTLRHQQKVGTPSLGAKWSCT